MEPAELYESIKPLIDGQINSAVEKKLREMQYSVARVAAHTHTGSDSLRVDFENIERKRYYLPYTVVAAAAATAANYGTFFIVPVSCTLLSVYEIHQVKGSSADAALNIEKLTGTTAPDSGTELLTTVFDLSATADTLQTGVLTTVLASKQLDIGDRLCLKDSGTLTNVSNVSVMLVFQF